MLNETLNHKLKCCRFAPRDTATAVAAVYVLGLIALVDIILVIASGCDGQRDQGQPKANSIALATDEGSDKVNEAIVDDRHVFGATDREQLWGQEPIARRTAARKLDMSALTESERKQFTTGGIVVWGDEFSRLIAGYYPSGQVRFIFRQTRDDSHIVWNTFGWQEMWDESGYRLAFHSDKDALFGGATLYYPADKVVASAGIDRKTGSVEHCMIYGADGRIEKDWYAFSGEEMPNDCRLLTLQIEHAKECLRNATKGR